MSVTIKLVTAASTNASAVADPYGFIDGVSWRNSVDNCDSNGCGRVFLYCDSNEIADSLIPELEADDDVVDFDIDYCVEAEEQE
jgi:hypothetical protein